MDRKRKVMVALTGWEVSWVNRENWLTTKPIREPVTEAEAKQRVFAEFPEAAEKYQVGSCSMDRFQGVVPIIEDPRVTNAR